MRSNEITYFANKGIQRIKKRKKSQYVSAKGRNDFCIGIENNRRNVLNVDGLTIYEKKKKKNSDINFLLD